MSFSIAFIGASPGKHFVDRRSDRRMGHSLPSSHVSDLTRSIAVDSARTLLGDPTSTVSGGATIELTKGAAAMHSVHALRSTLQMRVMRGDGSMLVTAWKSRLLRPDSGDQKQLTLSRSLFCHSFFDLVTFLDRNGLAALGPYGMLVDMFTNFSRQCPTGRFNCSVEFRT